MCCNQFDWQRADARLNNKPLILVDVDNSNKTLKKNYSGE
jgi:hypothetical protein